MIMKNKDNFLTELDLQQLAINFEKLNEQKGAVREYYEKIKANALLPIRVINDSFTGEVYACPICGFTFDDGPSTFADCTISDFDYCPNCSQIISWRFEDER